MLIPAALNIFELRLKLAMNPIIRDTFINKINKNTWKFILLKGRCFLKLKIGKK